jgi:endonuclease/exonuclease/phosphatase (EEP) superfamily protein YafD
MKKIVVAGLVLVSCWFVGSTSLLAQTTPSGQGTSGASANQASIDQDVSLLRKNLRAQKKQLIAANLTLTADQATKFWPVYDQYAAELSKLGDQKYALTKEYAQGFGSLINRSLALDENIAQLRRKYVPIVNQVLRGTKTATFSNWTAALPR